MNVLTWARFFCGQRANEHTGLGENGEEAADPEKMVDNQVVRILIVDLHHNTKKPVAWLVLSAMYSKKKHGRSIPREREASMKYEAR